MYRVHPYFEGFSFFGFVHRGGNEKGPRRKRRKERIKVFEYPRINLNFIVFKGKVLAVQERQI